MTHTKRTFLEACIAAALFVALLFVLLGCSTLKSSPATTQLVTQYAVAKYLEQRIPSLRYESAQRIIRIAGQLRVATGERTATLAALRPAVSTLIAEQPLSPADRILAQGLADVLFAEVEARIKPGMMDPMESVAIEQVLQWVVSVAQTVPRDA